MIEAIKYMDFSSEMISLIMLLFCCVTILIFFKTIGLSGLYIYNAVAIISSNIQVMQISYFKSLDASVALGTVTFATSFLVSDIIVEHYGKDAAKKCIISSFLAQISFVIIMLISLMHKSVDDNMNIFNAINTLFNPAWRILIGSMLAYIISQYFDIGLFHALKHITYGKFLWFRTILSTSISGFLDHLIFSYVACYILNPENMNLKYLITTYIMGAYIGRFAVNIISTPIIYISYYFKPKI